MVPRGFCWPQEHPPQPFSMVCERNTLWCRWLGLLACGHFLQCCSTSPAMVIQYASWQSRSNVQTDPWCPALGASWVRGSACFCRLTGKIGTVTGSDVGPGAKCLYSVPSTTHNWGHSRLYWTGYFQYSWAWSVMSNWKECPQYVVANLFQSIHHS